MPDTAQNWIVETDWLAARLDAPGLVIFDATWHLPTAGRDAKAEYLAEHIPGRCSSTSTTFPTRPRRCRT